ASRCVAQATPCNALSGLIGRGAKDMIMKREQAVEYVQQLKRDIHEAGKILREQGPEALTRFKAELLGQHWDRDGNIFDRYQRPSGFIWEIPAEYNPGPK